MPLSTIISLDVLDGGIWASFLVAGGEDMSAMEKHRIGNNSMQERPKCYFLTKDLAGILETQTGEQQHWPYIWRLQALGIP